MRNSITLYILWTILTVLPQLAFSEENISDMGGGYSRFAPRLTPKMQQVLEKLPKEVKDAVLLELVSVLFFSQKEISEPRPSNIDAIRDEYMASAAYRTGFLSGWAFGIKSFREDCIEFTLCEDEKKPNIYQIGIRDNFFAGISLGESVYTESFKEKYYRDNFDGYISGRNMARQMIMESFCGISDSVSKRTDKFTKKIPFEEIIKIRDNNPKFAAILFLQKMLLEPTSVKKDE